MAVTDTLINTLFDGRYRILRKLGSGGMANVYLAEDEDLGRRVAIKILNDRYANDELFIERFRREAKSAAALSHPNIVSIYDRGEAEGTYYIAMEVIEGRSLKELILTRGPLPIGQAIAFTFEILDALRFAHRHGIIHRDVKPHNILIGGERVKVTDFGIARAGASQMTETGSIIGTAQYLSPEQARGAPVDQTSDLYSLGIVLYELLTGTVPFTGDSPVEIAMKHLSATPERPSAKRPDVPPALDSIVLRALAKDPAQRYQGAEEMDADLERVARGLSVSPRTEEAATTVLRGTDLMNAPTTIQPAPAPVTQVRPPVPPAPSGRYYDYDEPRRRRAIWPWLLAILLVAAAVIAGVYVYQQIQRELDQTKPVGVADYTGIRELNAVNAIRSDGLSVDPTHIHRQPSAKMQVGFVFKQDPTPGERVDKGSFVTIWVSTGKPKAFVPDVRGNTQDDAVAAITAAGLTADVHPVPSAADDAGKVLAQDPKPGTKVLKGTKVRVNVGSGPKPVAMPDVVGIQYDSAASILQGRGFFVARKDVDSDQPAGVVVEQNPAANTSVNPKSTVTLKVSKGPKTVAIPGVVGQDAGGAKAALIAAGFVPRVSPQDTTDPTKDNVVLSQDPLGGTQAKPGATVTLVVGHFVGATTTAPTTTTTPIP